MSRKEQTIALIRGLRQVHATVHGKKPRRKRMHAPIHPIAIKAEYLKGIRAEVLEPMRDLAAKRLIPELDRLVLQAQEERGDSYKFAGVHADAASGKARELIEKLAKQFYEDVSPRQLEKLAERIGKRTSDFQKQELSKQLKAAMGVDPLMHEPASIAARVEGFTHENVALIKTVPQRFFGEIESRVVAGVRAGDRAEDIAQDIQDRYNVSETNAARIANDQVGKFFGELNRVRQTALGIEGYTWRGVMDNRERPEHEEREGEHFDWDDPPDGGHPGQEVNCRCWADPDLSDLLEDL